MRSLLFTPADSERKLAKGISSAADILLVDLEDAIAPGAKPAARAAAAEFLSGLDRTKRRQKVYVRINDLESGLADDDLAAVVPARPDGIMLPKAKSVADIDTLALTLDRLEADSGIAAGSTSILVLAIETPESILNIATFPDCGARVSGFTWGAEDLAAAIGAKSNRGGDGLYSAPFALARNLCLMAAAAAGVPAIDTVYVDFRDLDGLKRDAEEAARDGFSGKAAIHPDQVDVINEAFTPSAEEVAHAKAIVAAFEENPGAGAVGMGGRMVDRPHLAMAERTLQRARMAGAD